MAIGNGTARGSEQFVAEQLRQIRKVVYAIVSEAGLLFILPAISRVKSFLITVEVLQLASLVVCKTTCRT